MTHNPTTLLPEVKMLHLFHPPVTLELWASPAVPYLTGTLFRARSPTLGLSPSSLPKLVWFLRASWISVTSSLLKVTSQLLSWMSFGLLLCFLMVRRKLCVLGKNSTGEDTFYVYPLVYHKQGSLMSVIPAMEWGEGFTSRAKSQWKAGNNKN